MRWNVGLKRVGDSTLQAVCPLVLVSVRIRDDFCVVATPTTTLALSIVQSLHSSETQSASPKCCKQV